MGVRGGWLCAAAVLGAHAAGAAEFAELPPPMGEGLGRGVVALRCTPPSHGQFEGRAVVLDVGATAADVLLTTAHNLLPDPDAARRHCHVLVHGVGQAIAAVWHAGGNLQGFENDWAVIVTRRIPGDVRRWRAAQVTGAWLADAAAQSAPVRLVLRYADTAQSDCSLDPRTPNGAQVLVHSCVTYAGMSGSPLVVAVAGDADPIVIGVHVGSQLSWRGKKLEYVRIARAVDADVVAAIAVAASRATVPVSETPSERPRRRSPP